MRVRYSQSKVQLLKNAKDIVVAPDDLLITGDTFLEIGTGKGAFITTMAERFPKVNFIGFEKNATVLGFALEKVQAKKLTNVKLVNADFFAFETLSLEEKVNGIFLNFPDPWPKQKHEKRRLLSLRALSKFHHILKLGGLVFFKTDNASLFEFAKETFAASSFNPVTIDEDYQLQTTIDAETEYEHAFRLKGVKIRRGVFIKV
ncbi:MAG: tRNA (guanosine(46)-N7)-methyltransferase TrmB [Erysipelotrichaceae bacterium]|jgi:tRNA (guanine-N7-)-methyltransferase|nr:tRNA (guanosine(46)-N7)-methyltransferase TrmB [Erysipelotrichaceae bacterium]